MFKGIAHSFAQKYLEPYVIGLDKEKIQVGLRAGVVQFNDFFLKDFLTNSLDSGLKLDYGRIGCLKLNISWNNLISSNSSEALTAKVEDVTIFLSTNRFESDPQIIIRKLRKNKSAAIEQNVKSIVEEWKLSNEGEYAKNKSTPWFRTFMEKLQHGLVLDLVNINFFIQDLSRNLIIGLHTDKIKINNKNSVANTQVSIEATMKTLEVAGLKVILGQCSIKEIYLSLDGKEVEKEHIPIEIEEFSDDNKQDNDNMSEHISVPKQSNSASFDNYEYIILKQLSVAYEELCTRLNGLDNKSTIPYSFILPIKFDSKNYVFVPNGSMTKNREGKDTNTCVTKIVITDFTDVLSNTSLIADYYSSNTSLDFELSLDRNFSGVKFKYETFKLLLDFVNENEIRKKIYFKLLTKRNTKLELTKNNLEGEIRQRYIKLYYKELLNEYMSVAEVNELVLYNDIIPVNYLTIWQTSCIITQLKNNEAGDENFDSIDSSTYENVMTEEEREFIDEQTTNRALDILLKRPYAFKLKLYCFVVEIVGADNTLAIRMNDFSAEFVIQNITDHEFRNVNAWKFTISLTNLYCIFNERKMIYMKENAVEPFFLSFQNEILVKNHRFTVAANVLPIFLTLDMEFTQYLMSFMKFRNTSKFIEELTNSDDNNLLNSNILYEISNSNKELQVLIVISAPVVLYEMKNSVIILDLGYIHAATNGVVPMKNFEIKLKLTSFSLFYRLLDGEKVQQMENINAENSSEKDITELSNNSFNKVALSEEDYYNQKTIQNNINSTTDKYTISTLMFNNNYYVKDEVYKGNEIGIIEPVNIDVILIKLNDNYSADIELPSLNFAILATSMSVFNCFVTELLEMQNIYQTTVANDSAIINFIDNLKEETKIQISELEYIANSTEGKSANSIVDFELIQTIEKNYNTKYNAILSSLKIKFVLHCIFIDVKNKKNISIATIKGQDACITLNYEQMNNNDKLVYNLTNIYTYKSFSISNTFYDIEVLLVNGILSDIPNIKNDEYKQVNTYCVELKYNQEANLSVNINCSDFILQYHKKCINIFIDTFNEFRSELNVFDINKNDFHNEQTNLETSLHLGQVLLDSPILVNSKEKINTIKFEGKFNINRFSIDFWESFNESNDYEYIYAQYYGNPLLYHNSDLPTFGVSLFNSKWSLESQCLSDFELNLTVDNLNLYNYQRCTLSNIQRDGVVCFSLKHVKNSNNGVKNFNCDITLASFEYVYYQQDIRTIIDYINDNFLNVILIKSINAAKYVVMQTKFTLCAKLDYTYIYISEDKSVIPQFDERQKKLWSPIDAYINESEYKNNKKSKLCNNKVGEYIDSPGVNFDYLGGYRFSLKYKRSYYLSKRINPNSADKKLCTANKSYLGTALVLTIPKTLVSIADEKTYINLYSISVNLTAMNQSLKLRERSEKVFQCIQEFDISLEIFVNITNLIVVNAKLSNLTIELRDIIDLACVLDILVENITSGGYYPKMIVVDAKQTKNIYDDYKSTDSNNKNIGQSLSMSLRCEINEMKLKVSSTFELGLGDIRIAYELLMYPTFNVYSFLLCSNSYKIVDLRAHENKLKNFINNGSLSVKNLNDKKLYYTETEVNGIAEHTSRSNRLHEEYPWIPYEAFSNYWLRELAKPLSYDYDKFRISYTCNLSASKFSVEFFEPTVVALCVLGSNIFDFFLSGINFSSLKQYPKPLVAVMSKSDDGFDNRSNFRIPENIPFYFRVSGTNCAVIIPSDFSSEKNHILYKTDIALAGYADKYGTTFTDVSILNGALYMYHDSIFNIYNNMGKNVIDLSSNCICKNISILGNGGYKSVFDCRINEELLNARKKRFKDLSIHLYNFATNNEVSKYFSVNEWYISFYVYCSVFKLSANDIYHLSKSFSLLMNDNPSVLLDLPAPAIVPAIYSSVEEYYFDTILMTIYRYYIISVNLDNADIIILFDETIDDPTSNSLYVPLYIVKITGFELYVNYSLDSLLCSIFNTSINVYSRNIYTGEYEIFIEKFEIKTLCYRKVLPLKEILLSQRSLLCNKIKKDLALDPVFIAIKNHDWKKKINNKSVKKATIVSYKIEIGDFHININPRIIKILLWLTTNLYKNKADNAEKITNRAIVNANVINISGLPLVSSEAANRMACTIINPNPQSSINCSFDNFISSIITTNDIDFETLLENDIQLINKSAAYITVGPTNSSIEYIIKQLKNTAAKSNLTNIQLFAILVRYKNINDSIEYIKQAFNNKDGDSLLDDDASILNLLPGTELHTIHLNQSYSCKIEINANMYNPYLLNEPISIIVESLLPNPWTNLIIISTDVCIINNTQVYMELVFFDNNNNSIQILNPYTLLISDYEPFSDDYTIDKLLTNNAISGSDINLNGSYLSSQPAGLSLDISSMFKMKNLNDSYKASDTELLIDFSVIYSMIEKNLNKNIHRILLPPRKQLSAPIEAFRNKKIKFCFRPFVYSFHDATLNNNINGLTYSNLGTSIGVNFGKNEIKTKSSMTKESISNSYNTYKYLDSFQNNGTSSSSNLLAKRSSATNTNHGFLNSSFDSELTNTETYSKNTEAILNVLVNTLERRLMSKLNLVTALQNGFCSPIELTSDQSNRSKPYKFDSRVCNKPKARTNINAYSTSMKNGTMITEGSKNLKKNTLNEPTDCSNFDLVILNKVNGQYFNCSCSQLFIVPTGITYNASPLTLRLKIDNNKVITICDVEPKTYYVHYDLKSLLNSNPADLSLSFMLPYENDKKGYYSKFSNYSAAPVQLHGNIDTAGRSYRMEYSSKTIEPNTSTLYTLNSRALNVNSLLESNPINKVQKINILYRDLDLLFELYQDSLDIKTFTKKGFISYQRLFVINVPIILTNCSNIPLNISYDGKQLAKFAIKKIEINSEPNGELISILNSNMLQSKLTITYKASVQEENAALFDFNEKDLYDQIVLRIDSTLEYQLCVVQRSISLFDTAGALTKLYTIHSKFLVKNNTNLDLSLYVNSINGLVDLKQAELKQFSLVKSRVFKFMISIDGINYSCSIQVAKKYVGDNYFWLFDKFNKKYINAKIIIDNGIILCIIDDRIENCYKFTNSLTDNFDVKLDLIEDTVNYLEQADEVENNVTHTKNTSSILTTDNKVTLEKTKNNLQLINEAVQNDKPLKINSKISKNIIHCNYGETKWIVFYDPFNVTDILKKINININFNYHTIYSDQIAIESADNFEILNNNNLEITNDLLEYMKEKNFIINFQLSPFVLLRESFSMTIKIVRPNIADTFNRLHDLYQNINYAYYSNMLFNSTDNGDINHVNETKIIYDIKIHTVGISFVSHVLCQEILYCELNKIVFNLSEIKYRYSGYLSIANCQLDNQLENEQKTYNISPVIIANRGMKSFIDIKFDMSIPSFNIYITQLIIALDDCELELTTEIILVMQLFYKECFKSHGYSLSNRGDVIEEAKLNAYALSTNFLKYLSNKTEAIAMHRGNGNIAINIDSLIIYSFKLITWCSFIVDKLEFLRYTFVLFTKLLTLGGRFELQAAPISFAETAWPDGIRGPFGTIVNFIIEAYTAQVINSLAVLFGYSSLMTLPRFPVELFKTGVEAGFNTVNTFTNTFSSIFTNLTFDKEYIEKRQYEQKKHTISLGSGLQAAAKNFGEGVISIANVITKPVEGLKKEGGTGLIKGIVPGLMGTIIKPVDKIGQAVTNVFDGIKAEYIKARVANEKASVTRRRKQRLLFGNHGILKKYDSFVVDRFDNTFEGISLYVPIDAQTAICLYPNYINYISIYTSSKPKIIWSIPIQQLVNVKATSYGLRLDTNNVSYSIETDESLTIKQLYNIIYKKMKYLNNIITL